jgi:RNA polymerase sigma factor (sigma-70 family)
MPVDPPPRDASGSTTTWTLLDALGGGDADAAWRRFVERYRPFVRGLLARMVPRSDRVRAAEDEFWGYVFLSDALRRADRGRRFRPYLAGIVQNFALAWLRRQPATEPVTASSMPAAPIPGASQQELALWARNVLALALAALARELPAAAVALRGFYGLAEAGEARAPGAVSELAAALQTSVANVYQLLSRGRRRLRALVEEELLAGCADATELADELGLLLASLRGQTPGLFEGD